MEERLQQKKRIDVSGYVFGRELAAQNRMRKIKQYTTGGRYLKTYPGIKPAALDIKISTATIIGALTGKQQTAGGYRWKYAN